MSQAMIDAEVAQAIGLLADLLEIGGESAFRVGAYRRTVPKGGAEFLAVPGIGPKGTRRPSSRSQGSGAWTGSSPVVRTDAASSRAAASWPIYRYCRPDTGSRCCSMSGATRTTTSGSGTSPSPGAAA